MQASQTATASRLHLTCLLLSASAMNIGVLSLLCSGLIMEHYTQACMKAGLQESGMVDTRSQHQMDS